MYEVFFKLRRRPFLSAPNVDHYFPASVIDSARQTLERSIERGEGPGLIIGPPGTGKTLLCQVLVGKFHGPFAVALLSCGRLKTCQALLQAIHYELKLPYRGMDEGELRLSLMDYLEPTPDGPQGLLLVVDEAHTLPWRLLDEVRLVTNLVRDGQPRVRVVMAGGPALEERFASPKLGSFAQRVAARCYLEPLGSEETAAYVRAQFSMSGGDPARLISEEAVRSVYRATDGIPRLINQVCDHALVLAALGGHSKLTSEAIDESWADLQQLPSPWSASIVRDGAASQIVEFGHLSDDVESPEAIPFRASELTRHAKSTHSLHLATPDEQLDAIAEQLSEMEEPERPTATTEVDLDFPEFGDPFGEEFAEEELVLDNYASEFEIFAEVPRVASWEGRQIGSQLQPLAPTAPKLSAAQPTPPANRSTPPAEPAFSLPVGIPASNASRVEDEAFSAASDPVMPEEAEDCTIPPLASITAAAHPARATPAPVTAAAAPDVLVSDVSVLRTSSRPVLSPAGVVGVPQAIVVEEESTPTRVTSVTSPRRSEFRQLFSKLRRG
jgi:type II secretory pathway predicted ATPase ExeA